jgi:hypothetical protein
MGCNPEHCDRCRLAPFQFLDLAIHQSKTRTMSSAASLACASTDNLNELEEYNEILGDDFETKPLSDSERVPELPAQQMVRNNIPEPNHNYCV